MSIKVAAYAFFDPKSVPTKAEITRFFEYYIRSQEDRELVDVYLDVVDPSISICGRSEWKRLIADKNEGCFDVVLVPSLFQLSNNYIDAINYVRELTWGPHEAAVELMYEHLSTSDTCCMEKLQLHVVIMDAINHLRESARNLFTLFVKANGYDQPNSCVD